MWGEVAARTGTEGRGEGRQKAEGKRQEAESHRALPRRGEGKH